MKIHGHLGVGGVPGLLRTRVKQKQLREGKKMQNKSKKEDCGRLAHELSPFWQLQTQQQFKTSANPYP
jgi:hypothetical protein